MPLSSSWFYKLRTRRRSAARGRDAADAGAEADAVWLMDEPGSHRAPTTRPVQEVLPCPCSPPNRASYYVPTGDRLVLPLSSPKGNPKLRDTQFPGSPQPNDIVFDVVAVGDGRFDCLKAMPELKLRPILTRPAAKKNGNRNGDGDGSDSGTSAAASPTARVRRRRRRRLDVKGRADAQVLAVTGRHARRRWLYESLVVVKESADPEEDFLESMEEMIAAADGAVLRSPRGLDDLLACYLALNAAEHHRAIVGAFRRAWLVDTTNAAKPVLQAAQG